MKPALLAAFGTLVLAASGCVGDFEPKEIDPNTPNPNEDTVAGVDAGTAEPPPPGDLATARALFEANVAPVVTANCSSAGCHGGGAAPPFGDLNPLNQYDKMISQRDLVFAGNLAPDSRLIFQGTTGHQGAPVFSTDDLDAISAWLALEKLEADAGGEVVVSPLAEFSGCMTLANFEASNMADEWANKNAQGQGDCDACHNLGADGFMASNQDARMFSYISGEATKSAQFMPSYFTLDATGTSVVINRARLERVGSQLSPNENHGAFDLDPNEDAVLALETFFLATQNNPACGPPRF